MTCCPQARKKALDLIGRGCFLARTIAAHSPPNLVRVHLRVVCTEKPKLGRNGDEARQGSGVNL
jgi:hypothetical protein